MRLGETTPPPDQVPRLADQRLRLLPRHALPRPPRPGGETEQRLACLPAWRECPFYTDRERAALAWTEAVTLVADSHVSDAVYDQARGQFSEKELADLTLAIATINAWNRLSISARTAPGEYKPSTAHA